tara:strand:+ start:1757 stop:2032 length:276 start_codon:yes stop_codon:yes gene_type:complete
LKKLVTYFLPLIIVSFLLLKFYIIDNKDQKCYESCADFHIEGKSEYWDFYDYVIDMGDTIWIDKECYNEWCICIDECKPGLCCELLNKLSQ